MAQTLINNITLWEPDLGSDITPSGDPSIWGVQVEDMKLVEKLDDFYELELNFMEGAPLPLKSPQVLTERTVLKLQYGSTSPTYRLFRVSKVDFDTAIDKGVAVSAREMWADLGDTIIRRTLNGGYVDLSVTRVGLTLSEALTEVLSTDYGLPATFHLGTIDSAIADERVKVDFTAGSFLKFIRYLASQILDGCEFEFVWDGANSRYDINFYQEIGWTAGERTAGSADPTLRPIHGPGGTQANRIKTTHLRDTRDFFNRLIPLSGDPDNLVTIADAEFLGASESPAGTINLESDVRIVQADGELVGLFLGNEDIGFSEILTSAAGPPNAFTTDGTEADMVGEYLRFALDSAGTDLVFVDLKSSVDEHGPVEKVEQLDYVSPYPNLMVREGHCASMDEGSGAADSWLPTGAAKVGSPDTNQNTDDEFFSFGSGSTKVECNADEEGLEWSLSFPSDPKRTICSAWAHLRLVSGTVRIEIEGNDGDKWPPEEIPSTNETAFRGLAIPGAEPSPGTIKFKVIGITTGTVFYVDAVSVTRSADAYEYADKMGPATLFEAAVKKLKDEGGVIPPSIDGEVLDVTAVQAGTEILLGSHVEYKDLYLAGTPIIDVTSRVIEMTTYESPPPEGRFKKEVRLSSKRKDFSDRYRTPFGPPKHQKAPTSAIPIVDNVTWKWNKNGDVYDLVFTWFANRGNTKSILWELNEDNSTPGWSSIPTGGDYDGSDDMDASEDSSTVTISDVDPLSAHYLYVRGYPKASAAGNPGPTKRIAITALPEVSPFIGGFNGLSCLPRPNVGRWMMVPYIESYVDGEVRNYNEDSAPVPHGTIVDPNGELSWDTVEGLISVDTGTDGYVEWDSRVVGESLIRFQFIGHNIAKSAADEVILHIEAGTAGVYEVIKQADGTLRASVTSNDGGTTQTVDTTLVAPVGRSYRWAFQLALSGESPSPADFWIYLLTDTFSEERIHGVNSSDCSGEFTAFYTLYDGTTSARFMYGEGDGEIMSLAELRAAGICITQFAKKKGGGPTFGIDHDSYIVPDDTNITLYDLLSTPIAQKAHGLTMTHYCRPAYDPVTGWIIFGGVGGKVYAWDMDADTITLKHDFGGSIIVTGIFWSNRYQNLYYITSDSGSGQWGEFTSRTGTWSDDDLDTTYEFDDFCVLGDGETLFALKSNGDLGLYTIASDGSLTEDDTLTPGSGNLPSGTIVAVTYRNGQGYYVQYNDGSVGYLVEEADLSGDWFTILTSAHVYAHPGLALNNATLFGYACTQISSVDHIVRFPFDDEDLGTSDVQDKGAVGDVLRGLAMAKIGLTGFIDPITDLSVTANGSTKFDLTWTDSAGATGVKIWKRQNDSGPWLFHENVSTGGSATVTGFGPEELWCFVAQPYNSLAKATFEDCNSDCATTPAARNAVLYGQGRYIGKRDINLVSDADDAWYDMGVSVSNCRGLGWYSNRVWFAPDTGNVYSMLTDGTDVTNEYTSNDECSIVSRHESSMHIILDYDGTGDLVIKKWNGSSFATLVNVTDNTGDYEESPVHASGNLPSLGPSKIVVTEGFGTATNDATFWYCDHDGSNIGSHDFAWAAGHQVISATESEDGHYLLVYKNESGTFKLVRYDWGTWANETTLYTDASVVFRNFEYNSDDGYYYAFSPAGKKLSKHQVDGTGFGTNQHSTTSGGARLALIIQ